MQALAYPSSATSTVLLGSGRTALGLGWERLSSVMGTAYVMFTVIIQRSLK
jgi:hypothetical protein